MAAPARLNRAAPSGPLLPDQDGQVIYINEAALSAYQTAPEGTGAITSSFAAPGDDGGGKWVMSARSAPGTYSYEPGYTLPNGDGSAAWLRQYGQTTKPEWSGAVGDDVADDLAPLRLAFAKAEAKRGEVKLSKLYHVSERINVTAPLTVKGTGFSQCYIRTSSSQDVIRALNVTGLTFRDFGVYGNSSGAGGGGGTGGNGIRLDGCNNIKISGVLFDNIGEAAGFAAPISAQGCNGLETSACIFGAGNASTTGADILAGHTTRNTRTVACWTFSGQDAFVSLASQTSDPTQSDIIRHVVIGNVAERTDESCRHAVIATYSDRLARLTVTGNVFSGFIWTAVYLNPNTDLTLDGDVTIGNNVISHCGGENAALTGGIFASTGSQGTAIQGNQISFSGINPTTGLPRSFPASGIKIVQESFGGSIVGNVIHDCTGHGIEFSAQTLDIDGITVIGNEIRNNLENQIQLAANGGNISNVVIMGNPISHAADVSGVRVDRVGAGTLQNITIARNSIRKTGGVGTGYGVHWDNASDTGKICENECIAYATGVFVQTATARQLPENLVVQGNHLIDCTLGLNAAGSGNLIFLENRFTNCTTNLPGYNYEGRAIGYNSSGESNVEVDDSSAPGSGTWHQGDRVRNTAPVDGGTIGWVRTGTAVWKTYGSIAA